MFLLYPGRLVSKPEVKNLTGKKSERRLTRTVCMGQRAEVKIEQI